MRERNSAQDGVQPPRVIQPRKRGYVHMHLAVVHEGAKWHEDTGEIYKARYILCEDGSTKGNLPQYVRQAEPTIFVTPDPSTFLALLHETFRTDPNWHYTLTRTFSEFEDATAMSRVKLRTFGFRGPGTRKQRLHQCWDPRSISPTPVDKFIDGDVTHESLLAWAQDIRSWAREQDLELRNAFAGYAAQLLRDERFYPEPRRRVPRATNERARPALPGNLVSLYTPAVGSHEVTSIDQRSAHHRIAQEIDLPAADTLFARGNFDNPHSADMWAQRGTVHYERTIQEPGLLFVGMHSRRTVKGEYRLKVQDYQGYERKFIWSNQVQFLQSTGSHIEGIYAAWTSTSTDKGLPRFGKWAQNQIETCDAGRKKWLKPLLHSTYGLLAARPRPVEVGHCKAKGGRLSRFLLGHREFDVRMTRLRNWQPAIANVLQRGLIEAETQVRSLHMAQHLASANCQVLHIHTDGMHVKGQLPLLPDTWSMTELHRVIYLDDVSWVSDEKQCLPGRDAQLRQETINHYAQLHATITRTHSAGGLRSRLQRKAKRADVEASHSDVRPPGKR